MHHTTITLATTTALLVLVAGPTDFAARARETPPPSPWVGTARYELTYEVDLASIPAAKGERVRIWIPEPRTNPAQEIHDAAVESPVGTTAHEDRYGNRIRHAETSGPTSGTIRLRFQVARRPSTGTRTIDAAADDPSLYTRAANLIPLGGILERIALEQAEGKSTDEARVEAFYRYVVQNMRYDKSGTGWGRGDAVWACDHKRGNCTDFHSLFIGMARTQQIPARFVIGFPIPPRESGEIPGYHCWAEFHEESRGWRPVDASEAHKRGRTDDYFGTIPNDRVAFTVGRDLVLSPPQDGPPLNYFIRPHVEVNGRPVDPDTIRFRVDFRRLSS